MLKEVNLCSNCKFWNTKHAIQEDICRCDYWSNKINKETEDTPAHYTQYNDYCFMGMLAREIKNESK